MEEWILSAYFDQSASRLIDLDEIPESGPYSPNSNMTLYRADHIPMSNRLSRDKVEAVLGKPLKKTKRGMIRSKTKKYYMEWSMGSIPASTPADAVVEYARSKAPTKPQSDIYSGPSSKQQNDEFALIKNATVFTAIAQPTKQGEVLPAKDFDFDAI